MAITPAASGPSGKAAPSILEGMSSEPITTDTGIELESAPPPAAPLDLLPRGVPRGSAAAAARAVPENPPADPALSSGSTDSGDSAPEESSAAHLTGSSPAVVSEIEEKFARLLHEVHQNRPGDDLEIIRQAWLFCLQQHEGQKRASGEPYAVHPLEVALVLAEHKTRYGTV